MVTQARSPPLGIDIISIYSEDDGGRHFLLRIADETGILKLPIPVVFNLSSWAVKRQSITDWLIEELNTKYQVPRNTGESWVMDDQLLPLLDGLDEVALEYREDCVKAINIYRKAHGLVPTVVCSRNADYQALKTRLLLPSAVVVQPLTTQQIEDYLSSAGGHLDALRMALRDDPALQELAATPLMLNVLTLAYSGKLVESLVTTKSPTTRRRQIFATYVERMLTRRSGERRYTPQQTVQWLTWLAQQLTWHSQTEFYIERMQIDWLPENSARRFYHSSTRLVGRLAIGLIAGLVAGLTFMLSYASLTYAFFAVILGLITGLAFMLFNIEDTEPIPATGIVRPLVSKWQGFIKSLAIGLASGLITSLFSHLFNLLLNLLSGEITLMPQTVYYLVNAILSDQFLSVYLVAGLNAGLIVWLVGRLVSIGNTEIEPAEVITWSWVTMWKSLFKSLGTGLITGLTVGLSVAMVAGLAFWFVNKLDSMLTIEKAIANGVTFGLITGLSMWLCVGLVGGFSSSMLDERNRIIPNQGIRRSVRISAIAGLIGILVGGLIGGLIFGIVYELPFALLFHHISWFFRSDIGLYAGLGFGLVFGLVGGLPNGGAACIKHAILRLLLRRNGYIPRNYPRFLDYAAECILLRKVGGGYIFVHRLLLEYFASLNSTPTSHEAAKQAQMVSEDGRPGWQNVADTR